MFYLINEEDGLYSNEFILINTKSLELLETGLTKNPSKITVKFWFSSEKFVNFQFNKDKAFNVNQVIGKMMNLEAIHFKNSFLSLTDSQNVENLQSQQFYLHKFSQLMVNLNHLQLAYYNQEGNHIVISGKTCVVSESPKQIYDMIQEKIISEKLNSRK